MCQNIYHTVNLLILILLTAPKISVWKTWLINYSPVLLFYTPWKHRRYRKATPGFNRLSSLNQLNKIAVITVLQLLLIPQFIQHINLLWCDLAHATTITIALSQDESRLYCTGRKICLSFFLSLVLRKFVGVTIHLWRLRLL